MTAMVASLVLVVSTLAAYGQGAGVRVPEPPPLPGQKAFDLTLEETRKYSRSNNFEVVGHSYFKGEWVVSSARALGMGCGFNTPRVEKGIVYFAGYDAPPACFGVFFFNDTATTE